MRKKRYYNPPCINETRGGVDLLQQASRGHMQLSTPKLHTPGAELKTIKIDKFCVKNQDYIKIT